MLNNIQENRPKNLISDPWESPLSPTSEETLSHCVTPWLIFNTEQTKPILSPVNPPETLLLTTHHESSGQILWRDWLKLHQPDTQRLAKPLSQMWGLLYWQEHLASV